VFYPLEWVSSRNVPAWALRVYLCNPMAELLTAYRQILFEHRGPDAWLFAWPAVVAAVVFVVGVVVFRRLGPTLSDHL
jgi:ABC-type polysaccharide/polyol phosphate export permease